MEELRDTMNRFRSLINGMPEFKDELATTLALNAGQLVNSRIVDKGERADGAPLTHRSGKQYSDREIPTSVFVDSGMITASQARSLPIMSTYVDAKKAAGRYRGKRDLIYTGAMWKNTGLTAKQLTPGGFVATVAGKTAETQIKLDNNSRQSGVDVLELSKEEEVILSGDQDAELQAYIDRTGL